MSHHKQNFYEKYTDFESKRRINDDITVEYGRVLLKILFVISNLNFHVYKY